MATGGASRCGPARPSFCAVGLGTGGGGANGAAEPGGLHRSQGPAVGTGAKGHLVVFRENSEEWPKRVRNGHRELPASPWTAAWSPRSSTCSLDEDGQDGR